MSSYFVRKLKLGLDLPPADEAELETLCSRWREIAPKRYLSHDGERASTFPIVLSGWAARYQILRNGARQITGLLLPGDLCNRNADPCAASSEEIVTLSRCVIAFVNHSELEDLIYRRPAIAWAIQRYSAREAALLASWIVNVGRRDALERMAHFICEACFRLEMVGLASGSRFQFPLTQEDLADALGLTPVHTNRKLQQLRKEKLITLKSKELTILDRQGLESLAGFDSRYLGVQKTLAPVRVVPAAKTQTSLGHLPNG